jgi:hypothetical protein
MLKNSGYEYSTFSSLAALIGGEYAPIRWLEEV